MRRVCRVPTTPFFDFLQHIRQLSAFEGRRQGLSDKPFGFKTLMPVVKVFHRYTYLHMSNIQAKIRMPFVPPTPMTVRAV